MSITKLIHAIPDFTESKAPEIEATALCNPASLQIDLPHKQAIVIENAGGMVSLRVYTSTNENPVTVTLTPAGGVNIERTDFDKESN